MSKGLLLYVILYRRLNYSLFGSDLVLPFLFYGFLFYCGSIVVLGSVAKIQCQSRIINRQIVFKYDFDGLNGQKESDFCCF